MDRSAAAKKKTRIGRRIWWILFLLLAVLAAGAAWRIQGAYFFAGGNLYRRDAQSLDLRGRSVSEETYEQIRRTLPDAEILWDVPLSGGAADCTTEDLVLSRFQDGDLSLLKYFSSLRSIDAVDAVLTPEQYQAMSAALPGCHIRWSIPIGGQRYPSDAEAIVLSALSAQELPLFGFFEDLRRVSATDCTDYPAIMALRNSMPELEITWQVSLSGREYPQDAGELLVDDPAATTEQLQEALQYLPAVTLVRAPENNWSEAEKDALSEAWPEVTFIWPVTFRGAVYDQGSRRMDLSGAPITAAEVEELLKKGVSLTGVKEIDLSGSGITLADALRLKEVFPQADLLFDFELYGVPINSMDTFVDFSNIPMGSTEAVESIIPLMPKLEKIDMSDCGFDNETMDALNKKYDKVRVVWTLHITYYSIRTDDKAFRASSRYYGYFTDETLGWFRYCEDMICLDMGHRNYKDLSFLYEMPQLQYLVILYWQAKDLSPVGSLKNLKWLEMNRESAPSIAALKGCTGLRDLNISFMPLESQEDTYETILAMPWLERVWFSRAQLTEEQERKLLEANPNLMMKGVYDWNQSNADPWRFDQDYYDMRDLLGMFYMNGTGRINYKIIDGVRYDLDPEFIAQQGDATHDRERTNQ